MIMVQKYFKGNARTFQVIPHQQIFIDEDKSRFQVQEELSAGDMQTGYRLPSVTDFAQLNCTERDLTDRTDSSAASVPDMVSRIGVFAALNR